MGLVDTSQSDGEQVTTRDHIFQFIVQYKRDHDGNSPSMREIADACFLSNPSTVKYHLTQLELENRLHLVGGGARQIEIVGAAWDYPNSPNTTEAADQNSHDSAVDHESFEF